MKYRRMIAVWLVAVFLAVIGSTQSVYTIRSASGDLTAGETTSVLSTRGRFATITLDVTTLTLADADDEVDFYIQTTYDGGTNWVDCQNIHFDNSDNGATALKSLVVDGAMDGPGSIKSIAGTNPAAGNEISETVPANTIWGFQGMTSALVTDGNAANRQVHLVIDDGTTGTYRSVAASLQTASLTYQYNVAAHGITATVIALEQWIPIPARMFLAAGYRITTATDLLEAGDDWGAPQLSVEEWHDPLVLTDGTVRDNVRIYDRQLGSEIRIKTAVTGATAPTYAYSAVVLFQ